MYQLVPSIFVACNWWCCTQNPLVTNWDRKTPPTLKSKTIQHHPQRHNIKMDWQGNKKRWSAVTKKNIECRHALAGSGQLGILAKHPDVVKDIKTQLQGLHMSGLPVNALIACSIMLAIIKHHAPDLLVKFKCLEASLLLLLILNADFCIM